MLDGRAKIHKLMRDDVSFMYIIYVPEIDLTWFCGGRRAFVCNIYLIFFL